MDARGLKSASADTPSVGTGGTAIIRWAGHHLDRNNPLASTVSTRVACWLPEIAPRAVYTSTLPSPYSCGRPCPLGLCTSGMRSSLSVVPDQPFSSPCLLLHICEKPTRPGGSLTRHGSDCERLRTKQSEPLRASAFARRAGYLSPTA